MICPPPSRTRPGVRAHPGYRWRAGGPTRRSVGRRRCREAGPGVGTWGRGPSEGGGPGVGLARGPRAATLREFLFRFGPGRRRRGRPGTTAAGALGVNPKAPQAPRARLHVSPRSWCREETERERKQETRVPGKSCRASGNYKNVTPRVGLPATTLTCRVHPSASSCPLGSVPPQRRSACARLAVSNQPETSARRLGGEGRRPGRGGRNLGQAPRSLESSQQSSGRGERKEERHRGLTLRSIGIVSFNLERALWAKYYAHFTDEKLRPHGMVSCPGS